MPYKIVKDGNQYCLEKLETGERVDGSCHDTEEETTKMMAALYANVEEMDAEDDGFFKMEDLDDFIGDEFAKPPETPETPTSSEPVHEIGMVTEFKGAMPDVPIAPGVDKNALTSGVHDPVFVTMKIAEIGRVSRAGVTYDRALVESIVEQVNQKRVGGNFGHIAEIDRMHAFPLPDALWVGATLVGNTAYGKAYIRTQPAAEYVRHLKAVNGALGTSIWGDANYEPAEKGARHLRNLRLEKIDFAPAERASLYTGGDFQVTSEMAIGDNNMPVTKEALEGVSAADLYALLNDVTRSEIAELYASKQGKKVVVAEMALDSARIAEFEAMNTENQRVLRENNALIQRVAEYSRVEFESGLQGVIDGEFATWQNIDKLQPNQQLQFNSVKSQLKHMVVSELAGKQDLSLAKAKADAILESDSFRPVVEMMRDAFAGGSAITGGNREQAREAQDKAAEERAKEWVG